MTQHVDVLIVGAGLSGIGAAVHLRKSHPQRSFAIFEARDAIGGTWDLFRYPGIRSDSDMFTLGYVFKPWTDSKAIADGPSILRYVRETAAEHGIDRHIRFRHRVVRATWSSADARWTVEADVDGERVRTTCQFLYVCSGYYRYDAGYTPEFPGRDRYRGTFVHPQHWPEDLDYAVKKVVVIGSGATAVTLVPAMAEKAAHVTMLQRSPTYFIPGPNRNELADTLRALDVDPDWIHEMVRRKILHDQKALTEVALAFPNEAKAHLIEGVRAQVGPDFDVATHFTPRYAPWEQRIAFVPEGDLFTAVKTGKADIVTDHIEHFTPTGIHLQSGRTLEVDVVITATGFNLAALGDVAIDIDGVAVRPEDRVTWRGMMLSDVPNLVWVFGYFRASWTLRVDLIGDFVCRLLSHMDAHGYRSVAPHLRPEDMAKPLKTWSEGSKFAPGYIQRGAALLPKRGEGPEWTHTQDYWSEQDELPRLDFAQAPLRFA